ncbi:hypothetical protein [Winogradskyella eximia]|uniref:hypothetical protein n=1 Tax=Winogradskyella eximia TaxID=262006 RepID=UPI0024910948|nr:hypothetical protein [Winogradskyella eximia]
MDNSVAIREILRAIVAKQHLLNFEETSLRWEGWRAEVKQNYFFPKNSTISLCFSIDKIEFCKPYYT